MTEPIVPARLALREDGTPFSATFDDVYHSTHGVAEQARHVFLAGNQLPARWASRRVFTIVETGFGLGVNFLATWAEWCGDTARCDRLHFVSIEKHPLVRDDLARAHAHLAADPAQATLRSLATRLLDAWPTLCAGLHRIEFPGEGGQQVVLTLFFGDAATALPNLRLRADAFFLDGFAPSKNPGMWSDAIFKALARLADLDASCATYTVAGDVRRGLQAVGFDVSKAPGYGPKRDMLSARFAPRWRVRRHEPPLVPRIQTRDALVIGAGIAGCALAQTLSARGWQVTLLERGAAPASDASGNPAAVFHPLLARGDSPAARLSRAGFLYALRRWAALEAAGHRLDWHPDGLLQIAANAEQAAMMADTLGALGLPRELVTGVTRDEAGQLAGIASAAGGWFFPRGGWIDPVSLCTAQLASAGARLTARFGVSVDTLIRRDGRWHALDTNAISLGSASVAIVANSHDAARVAGLAHAPTDRVRGQLALLPAQLCADLRMPVLGDGYLTPGPRGTAIAGASYEPGDTDPCPRCDSHVENLARPGRLLPPLEHRLDAARTSLTLQGHAKVGFRCVASDRLPLIGQLADEEAARANADALSGAHPLDLPRTEGLYGAFGYGSRGLVWSALGAELLACLIEGEPLPLEKDLADAIDPARFLLRELRHKRIA